MGKYSAILQIFQLSSGANNDGKEIQQVEQISVQIWRELRNRATGTYFSIGVAKLDRDVPLLLLLEADSVNSGESLDADAARHLSDTVCPRLESVANVDLRELRSESGLNRFEADHIEKVSKPI